MGEVFYVASCLSYAFVAVNHLPPQITKRIALFCLMCLAHAGQDVAGPPGSHADEPGPQSGRQVPKGFDLLHFLKFHLKND